MKEPVGVSLCLLGIPCRYDGGHKRMKGLERFLERFSPVPFCPEQLAGLTTPRLPAQFYGGDARAVLKGKAKIVNEKGEDVTEKLIKGCEYALEIAELAGVKRLFLKEKSPCCGLNRVWVEDELVAGCGLIRAMIEDKGLDIKIYVGDVYEP